MTIKANWVRGAGNVSVAVFFSDGLLRQRSEPRPIAANAPADLAHSASLPGLSLESAELPRPEPGKDEVLTIRAQVI